MIDEKIDGNLLKQAIKVLKEINKNHYKDSSKKKPLLEDEKETPIYLQFSLKKIPKCKSIKMIKVNLPHSLMKDNGEVCLITGDLDKRNHKAEIEPDIIHYKEILKKHNINRISEVVTLRQLRTEYKPYEAKQKLLAAYDVFLADRKIAECLPKVLGRHFFKKRKFPIQITLNTPNLKQQVEKALDAKIFYLTGHGNSCNSEVAYLDMKDTEISENVITMAKTFCNNLPGSWDNVMGIYLKTSLSKAIPVYISYDDPNKVHLEEEKVDNRYEIDELSTFSNKIVKVYKDGNVRTVRIKRMAECETADINKNSEKKKKKEENINDDSGDSLARIDLNEESAMTRQKAKNKKKVENIQEEEVDKSICKMKEKEASSKIKRKSRSKKTSEESILQQETCNMEKNVSEETKNVDRKSKTKKIEKNSLMDENEKIFPSADLIVLEETKKVDGKSKSKKVKRTLLNENEKIIPNPDLTETVSETKKVDGKSKSKKVKRTVLDENEKIIQNTDLIEISDDELQSQKKRKSKRKSEGNVLLNEASNRIADLEKKVLEETKKIDGKSKTKKVNKRNLLKDENEEIVPSIDLIEISDDELQIQKKPKSKRKSEGNVLLNETSNKIANSEKKVTETVSETKKVDGKSKSKKVKRTFLDENEEIIQNTDLIEISDDELQSQKKPKNKRKSEGKVLLNETSNKITNSEKKDKQKKRKSVVNKL